MTISVVVADDQTLVRAGFRLILDSRDDLEVVGEAADGAAAVDLVTKFEPDVALMDVRMPVLDGIEATKRIVAAGLSTRIVMLTTFDVDEYVVRRVSRRREWLPSQGCSARRAGRRVRVVARAMPCSPPPSPDVCSTGSRRRCPTRATTVQSPSALLLAQLTDRESEVLRQVAAAHSNGEIADHLEVSEATVKTHVSAVLRKLGVRDRVQAVVFAYEAGLVHPGQESSHR